MHFSDVVTPQARARLLGERLIGHRQERNLTQAEAAARAGLSRDAVQRAERGGGTVDTLLRLLAAYGLVDRLELVLPEPEIGPMQRLATQRPARRQRVRHPAGKSEPDPLWGEEE